MKKRTDHLAREAKGTGGREGGSLTVHKTGEGVFGVVCQDLLKGTEGNSTKRDRAWEKSGLVGGGNEKSKGRAERGNP